MSRGPRRCPCAYACRLRLKQKKKTAAVGLICNESKREFITTSYSEQSIKSLFGENFEKVEDFKYLGSSIMNSDQGFKNRKGMAWSTCNKLDKIWQSDMHNSI